jgi:hypothetical protein
MSGAAAVGIAYVAFMKTTDPLHCKKECSKRA